MYEYAVVTYAVFGADALNAMAADGWEFVQHVYNLENHNVVVWRRPRPCTDPVAP